VGSGQLVCVFAKAMYIIHAIRGPYQHVIPQTTQDFSPIANKPKVSSEKRVGTYRHLNPLSAL
jgi:hypothetical protein